MKPIVLNDDAGWCWFQGPRAVLAGDWLVAGTIANGQRAVELSVLNVSTRERKTVKLADWSEDDHNSPALWQRPDGRWFASYTRHGQGNEFRWHLSEDETPLSWGEAGIVKPCEEARLTYQNLVYLRAEGRLYNFMRGVFGPSKPGWMVSEDGGESWQVGGTLLRSSLPRPYVKFASDGTSEIHYLYTDGHPIEGGTGLWHAWSKRGRLRQSNGMAVRELPAGLLHPDEGTSVFYGLPNARAWCVDLVLDHLKRPYGLFSVRHSEDDHRYHYARWNGRGWQTEEITCAGERLYREEIDYTGLGVIDPRDPKIVYISTNVDPSSGERLPHRELFKGRRECGGWSWHPLTQDSPSDNLRPVIATCGQRAFLLWLRGIYRSYTDFTQSLLTLEVGL